MYSTSYYDLVSTSSSSAANTAQGIQIWSWIAIVLAIVGGILVYFLFTNAKNNPKGKFVKWLKDFLNFKVMWLETILKIAYYVLTIFTILYSFTFLTLGGIGVLYWLIGLILGPVLIRLGYELFMLFIGIWRNTKDIADNTKKK